MKIELTPAQASTAAGIQAAIDSLGKLGGTIVLPAGEFTLDRGIELRPNVCLEGQGENTWLRKGPGRIYPLAGYHNYGMMDVPLKTTAGLQPGMIVAIRDNIHGGFNETMARITWVDDDWVGLDRGIESDYYAEANAILVTAYPLIFGLGSHGAAIHNLCLDGAKEDQEAGIGACRGSAIYFYQTDGITVENVIERNFMGEGIGFQMCAHTTVHHSIFNENTGNGLHPGAGSTIALLEDCTALGNGSSGFFFCVRANHITVRHCDFGHNKEKGISIGKRDCYNLIQECHIHDNGEPGIGFRGDPKPVEEHSIRIECCNIAHNCQTEGLGEIVLGDATHDIVLVNNHISGQTTGVYAPQGAERIYLHGNSFDGVSSAQRGSNATWAEQEPSFVYGCDSINLKDLRHLSGYL